MLRQDGVRASVDYLHLQNSQTVLSGYLGDERDVRRWIPAYTVNSDYHPYVEFSLDSKPLRLPEYFPALVSALRQGSIREHLDWTGLTESEAKEWLARFGIYERAAGFVLQAHGEQAFLSRLLYSHLGLRLLPGYPPLVEQQEKSLADIEQALRSSWVDPNMLIAEMDRQIQADAGFGTAWLVKSLALRQQGRLPQALEAGEHALTLAPSMAKARENLGLIQQRLNSRISPVNIPKKPSN